MPSRFCLLVAALFAGCGESSSGEADWMASLDDGVSIAALSLPGSHDSGARFEPYMGIAATQTLTIDEQLAAGVRYFDVRCRHVDDRFAIYHGAIDQNQTFDAVLSTMYAFLDAHPAEVVVMSIKEEGAPSHDTRTFGATFDAYVAEAPERWRLAPSVPSVGDARGTLVLLRRFAATTPALGVDATQWPDNVTFSIDGPDAHLRIEDEYEVSSNDAKWSAITSLLDEAAAGDPETWMLTYTSGYQTISGLPSIPSVADDINARLDTLLSEPARGRARLGTVVMDFVDSARVAAIIATNGL